MATRVTIGIGNNIIVQDGKEENSCIKQGVINRISDVPGTNNKWIDCEGPFSLIVEF